MNEINKPIKNERKKKKKDSKGKVYKVLTYVFGSVLFVLGSMLAIGSCANKQDSQSNKEKALETSRVSREPKDAVSYDFPLRLYNQSVCDIRLSVSYSYGGSMVSPVNVVVKAGKNYVGGWNAVSNVSTFIYSASSITNYVDSSTSSTKTARVCWYTLAGTDTSKGDFIQTQTYLSNYMTGVTTSTWASNKYRFVVAQTCDIPKGSVFHLRNQFKDTNFNVDFATMSGGSVFAVPFTQNGISFGGLTIYNTFVEFFTSDDTALGNYVPCANFNGQYLWFNSYNKLFQPLAYKSGDTIYSDGIWLNGFSPNFVADDNVIRSGTPSTAPYLLGDLYVYGLIGGSNSYYSPSNLPGSDSSIGVLGATINLFGQGFSSFYGLMALEVMPSITLGTFVLIPLIVLVVVSIIRLIRS